MNNPHYSSYMATIHQPAKRAVEGDRAVFLPGERTPLMNVQSCLAGSWDFTHNCRVIFLFDKPKTVVAGLDEHLLSIEPTEEIEAQYKLQKEIDDINTATMGIAFKQLFKKK
jgi:hypothetical protein